MSRTWILICNPQMWDVNQFFDDGHTAGIWKANHCGMNEGDLAVLRVAKHKKNPVSIYAIAEITGKPDLASHLDSVLVHAGNKYWKPGEEPTTSDLFVPLKFTHILYPNPLPVSKVKAAGGNDKYLQRAPQKSCVELELTTFWKIETLAEAQSD